MKLPGISKGAPPIPPMDEGHRELLSVRRGMDCLERGQNNLVVQSSVTGYWRGGGAGWKLAVHQGYAWKPLPPCQTPPYP